MTKKVFWQDPYLTELNTRIATVNSNEITLDETIFYAMSGGQESDAGTIGDKSVVNARKDQFEIIYTLEDGHGLKAGEPAAVRIDWERRYRLMRLHFAAEVVLELVYQKFGDIEKVGAHIAQEKARIDFTWDGKISEVLPELQREANRIVDEDQPIISGFSDEANEKRYWEIKEFSRVPCGGTHLKRTSEIGAIELKRKNIGKGKERIEIFVA